MMGLIVGFIDGYMHAWMMIHSKPIYVDINGCIDSMSMLKV
jgi:hypothetical protein